MKKSLTTLVIALLSALQLQAQQCEVKFNLNYNTSQQVEPISVKQGCALPLDKKPLPQREGYRFGGWYTSPDCQPADEWLFGKMVGMMGAFMQQANDSMKVEQPMTLYARWIAPTHIKTAEELNRMRDDLYGWYVLDNDIDMSGFSDWEQVGVYEADYEWAEGEWWKKAFKGKLDGQGHTIRNLKFTQPTSEKKALFGSMMNGEICNLVIEDFVVDMSTTSMYVAPLVGIMKQGGDQVNAITNVQVKNAKYKVNLNNTQGAFSAVTFLTAGAWNGSISHCSVQGEMDITFKGTGGGQFYVGGFAGENYSEMDDCQADVRINIQFAAPEAAKDFSVFVGGLAASATNVKDCLTKGTITIQGDPLTQQFYVGGLIGSERYGEVSGSKAQMQITLSGMPQAQTGGILGEFNKTFGGVGAALGMKKTSVHDCQADVKVNADPSVKLTHGIISGSGQPEPLKAWGGQMEYEVQEGNAIEVKAAPAPTPKKKRAAMRDEIIEAEDDDNVFSLFTYQDDDVPFGYFLGMGQEYKISEILIDKEFSNTLITGFTETCLLMGETYDEASAFLDQLLSLYDAEVGTIAEFPCRLSKGGVGVGEPSTALCEVRKKLLGGRRLHFIFKSGNRQAEAFLDKSVVKELRMGLRLDKKLHKNRHQ